MVSQSLGPGTARFIPAGVEDLTGFRRANRKDNPVAQALAGRPSGVTALLSHTPWETKKAASAGIDLMLSGHTHGGQIWPFGYLVRSVYPLLAGQYDVNGMAVIVCRGTGRWSPHAPLASRRDPPYNSPAGREVGCHQKI